MAWLMATKLDMTRVVKGDKFVPVTLLQVPEIRVVGFKTLEKDGYESIIIGTLKKEAEGKLKEWNTTLSKSDFNSIKEFPVSKEHAESMKVGDAVTLDILEGVEVVTVTGTSKWRGFAGAMKRHNFHGWPATHGSKFHRALGSIGNRKPTRTPKGKKMHGHYGTDTVSIKKVPVELVNKEMWVVGIRGWVPGGRNSQVLLTF